jgi:hypothetical protein
MSPRVPLFEGLKAIGSRQLPALLEGPFTTFLPKNSKALGTNFIKDVYSIAEPRILVITGHLYLDYVLNRIVAKELASTKRSSRASFHENLSALNAANKLDIDTFQALSAVNGLRNRFAHNLFFDVSEWDPTAIPYVNEFRLRVPQRHYLRQAFAILLLRFTFLVLLSELSQKYRWIYLENVRRRCKRANSAIHLSGGKKVEARTGGKARPLRVRINNADASASGAAVEEAEFRRQVRSECGAWERGKKTLFDVA